MKISLGIPSASPPKVGTLGFALFVTLFTASLITATPPPMRDFQLCQAQGLDPLQLSGYGDKSAETALDVIPKLYDLSEPHVIVKKNALVFLNGRKRTPIKNKVEYVVIKLQEIENATVGYKYAFEMGEATIGYMLNGLMDKWCPGTGPAPIRRARNAPHQFGTSRYVGFVRTLDFGFANTFLGVQQLVEFSRFNQGSVASLAKKLAMDKESRKVNDWAMLAPSRQDQLLANNVLIVTEQLHGNTLYYYTMLRNWLAPDEEFWNNLPKVASRHRMTDEEADRYRPNFDPLRSVLIQILSTLWYGVDIHFTHWDFHVSNIVGEEVTYKSDKSDKAEDKDWIYDFDPFAARVSQNFPGMSPKEMNFAADKNKKRYMSMYLQQQQQQAKKAAVVTPSSLNRVPMLSVNHRKPETEPHGNAPSSLHPMDNHDSAPFESDALYTEGQGRKIWRFVGNAARLVPETLAGVVGLGRHMKRRNMRSHPLFDLDDDSDSDGQPEEAHPSDSIFPSRHGARMRPASRLQFRVPAKASHNLLFKIIDFGRSRATDPVTGKAHFSYWPDYNPFVDIILLASQLVQYLPERSFRMCYHPAVIDSLPQHLLDSVRRDYVDLTAVLQMMIGWDYMPDKFKEKLQETVEEDLKSKSPPYNNIDLSSNVWWKILQVALNAKPPQGEKLSRTAALLEKYWIFRTGVDPNDTKRRERLASEFQNRIASILELDFFKKFRTVNFT